MERQQDDSLGTGVMTDLEHSILHLGLQHLLMLHPLLHPMSLHLCRMVFDHLCIEERVL